MVNREPHAITVDGAPHAFTVMKGNDGYAVFLPAGAHRVEMVAGDAFSYGINLTSFWSSTAIAWFGRLVGRAAARHVCGRYRAPPHYGCAGKESGRMTLLELDLSALFVVAVILIWFMIGYQFLLTVFGYINFIRSTREQREVDAMTLAFPTCTILIPAHNEEKVIRRTVESMCRLEYPADRLRIMVINDGSTDGTQEIVQELAAADPRVVLFDVPRGQGGKGKSRALNLGIREVHDGDRRDL